MRILNLFYASCLAITLISVSACSSLNSAVGGVFGADTDLTLSFKVDSDINPDENKTPSPLFIRMYELKSTKLFDKANFIDIYEQDKATLGEDFVAVQKLKRLKPGEDRENSFVLNKNTRFVALYAEFLNYKNAKYKLVIPVVQHDVIGTTIVVKVSGDSISDPDKVAQSKAQ